MTKDREEAVMFRILSEGFTELARRCGETGQVQFPEELLSSDEAEDIAAAARAIARNMDGGSPENSRERLTRPLSSIFNSLNNNNQNYGYEPENDGIPFPKPNPKELTADYYGKLKKRLTEQVGKISWKKENVNRMLMILEDNLSYIPALVKEGGPADISMYQYLKMAAALGSSILVYTENMDRELRKKKLTTEFEGFLNEKAFLIYSMDISGIQSFIYTIHTREALKTLRARSFYLELLTEHMIDNVLESLGLTRAHVIYSGGGHCYFLLPDTEDFRERLSKEEEAVNQWLLQQFETDLYVGGGYAECSANELCDKPEGAYGEIFRTISKTISRKKAARYTTGQIIYLNSRQHQSYTEECSVCRRLIVNGDDGRCQFCAALSAFSSKILSADFFSVGREKSEDRLALPGGYYLSAGRRTEAGPVRIYAKNAVRTNEAPNGKLWVGSYTAGETFQEYAEKAEGINRIAIFRADVDNLGTAFVSGFSGGKGKRQKASLSRTAALSGQLALFFKYYINDILQHGTYSLDGKPEEARNVVIVYSGGDDLFVAGAWNEVIEFAVDIRNALKRFTQGTLTLSGGIGIYQDSYPISAIAAEVENMENSSKRLPGKDAVTIFEDGVSHLENDEKISDGTYHWDEFIDQVIGEKYVCLRDFFQNMPDRGNSFLYNLLELIRNREDRINIARFAYLLGRMEPDAREGKERQDVYREFARKMYDWIRNDRDSRQLKTAINLYAYKNRNKEEKEENNE